MSKKINSSAPKAAKAKKTAKSKRPTVAEAVAERKAEQAAAETAAVGQTTVSTPEATLDATSAPKAKGKKAKAPKADKPTKVAKAKKDGKPRLRDDGTYSVLDAAHKVLQEAGTPLDSQTILERALAEGYWKTTGKTPQATIYAAIIREIAAKGDAARFKKVDRGQFAAAK